MNDTLQLREEFTAKKQEASRLRSELSVIHTEKENFYKQLKALRDKLKQFNAQIKTIKEERDQLTTEVKTLKEQREQFNALVHEKSSARKEVEEKKKRVMEHLDVRDHPGRLRSEISRLEHRIETEVMPFSKEQELTKYIKELKARLKEVEKLGDVWKEVNSVTADFAEHRRLAQEAHKKVQEKAQRSQEKHELVMNLFEKIKAIREEEKPILQQYTERKAKFEQAKKQLDDILSRVNGLARVFHEEEERGFQIKARERTEEVTEKLKRKKKLSTEDILAFQALKE